MPEINEPLPAPAGTLIQQWEAWQCRCGSLALFEARLCCGSPMRPVRVEIHAREVPDA